MNIEFTLNEIEDVKHRDGIGRAEFFQTWQITELQGLDSQASSATGVAARQGYSLAGAPNEGRKFKKGQTIVVNDPTFTFALPELEVGGVKAYRLDLHFWEADNKKSTEKIRQVYNDSTLNTLVSAYQANSEDQEKTLSDLNDWLEENGTSAVNDALSTIGGAAATAAAPWVALGIKVLPVFKMLMQLALQRKDDYINRITMVLNLNQKSETELAWRVTYPTDSDAIPQWIVGEGVQKVNYQVSDASNKNVLNTEMRYKVISVTA